MPRDLVQESACSEESDVASLLSRLPPDGKLTASGRHQTYTECSAGDESKLWPACAIPRRNEIVVKTELACWRLGMGNSDESFLKVKAAATSALHTSASASTKFQARDLADCNPLQTAHPALHVQQLAFCSSLPASQQTIHQQHPRHDHGHRLEAFLREGGRIIMHDARKRMLFGALQLQKRPPSPSQTMPLGRLQLPVLALRHQPPGSP